MRPAPTPAARVPAVAAMMADRFDDREWFGMGDGAIVEQAPAAPPAPAEAFLIEPPPWEGQIALGAPPEPEPLPRMNAVEALKAAEAWEPPDLDLAPPMVTPPLIEPAATGTRLAQRADRGHRAGATEDRKPGRLHRVACTEGPTVRPCTVIGTVADQIGAASYVYCLWPRTLRRYIAAPSTRYRVTQGRVPVMIDHRASVGTVEHLELDADRHLVAVAVVDGDTFDRSRDWFWSHRPCVMASMRPAPSTYWNCR